MALRKPQVIRSAASSGDRRASAFEDELPPALPERMRDRNTAPVDADDVHGLRDALRAAGVREVQLITLTTRQIESVNKLEATFAKVAETFEKMAESIPRLNESVTRLADLLGAGAAPATRGAYADASPGGRDATPTSGHKKTPTPPMGVRKSK